MALRKLPRSFYMQPTLKVAKGLLGCFLVRRVGIRNMVGRIVEVEAYLGSRDPASHAFRGRTKRNEAMFRQGGTLYVYFTYGMHFCANVVTEEEGTGHAVLLRAIEPVTGMELMMKRRQRPKTTNSLVHLTNGPAKLCEAFGIARKENGTDLLGRHIWIARDSEKLRTKIGTSTRIGISTGKEHRWRFYFRNNRFVSKGKPSTVPIPL
ncbi:MAG: DNA-3-methyladenine glycosylase [Bacteroidota bacterium]